MCLPSRLKMLPPYARECHLASGTNYVASCRYRFAQIAHNPYVDD